MKDNVPEDWGDEDARIDDAARRLQELKDVGIDAIVDPTALGLGRYIPRIATVASRIDLKILVATGLYTFDALPQYWGGRVPGSGPNGSDPMVDLFVRTSRRGSPEPASRLRSSSAPTDRPGLTPGCGARAAGVRAGPPRDRRPDHNAHPRGVRAAVSISRPCSGPRAWT
jgi:phosphotriesterase-related protein